MVQTLADPQQSGDGIGGRSCEDRQGEQPSAHHAGREQKRCELAGNGLERLSSLRGGRDIRDPFGVQGGRCGHDHEIGDQVRHAHAHVSVDAQTPQLSTRLLGRDPQGLVRPNAIDLLDLLLGLPEEEIRADDRAEDGDDRRDVFLAPVELWPDGGAQRLQSA
jgi:hypothetical protein